MWQEMNQEINIFMMVEAPNYLEVQLVLLAEEEGVDDPVPEGVDGELGDPEEILPLQEAAVPHVKLSVPGGGANFV